MSLLLYIPLYFSPSHCMGICARDICTGGKLQLCTGHVRYDTEGILAVRVQNTGHCSEEGAWVHESISMERWGAGWLWSRVGRTAKEICGWRVNRGVMITQSWSIQLSCDERDIWAEGIADCMASISRGGWGGLYWRKAARDRRLDTGSKTSQGKEGPQCLDHGKDPYAMQLVLVQRCQNLNKSCRPLWWLRAWPIAGKMVTYKHDWCKKLVF